MKVPLPPETTITDYAIDSPSATFGFTSSKARSTFKCRLDGGDWQSCPVPTTYPAFEAGSHTFSVRAADAAGNVDPTPASQPFTIDSGPDIFPPETTIDSGPTGTITTGDASFGFSSSEPGSTFQCRLDAAAWSGCSSRNSYSSLGDGAHTVSVRAIDAAGNTDSSPASRSFTVDAPTVSPTGAIPGTGAILQQDLATNPDPVPLWKQLTSGPSNGVSYSATGGDTHPTIDGSAQEGYRRVRIQDGDQGPGDTTQERLQVGKRDRAAPYNDTFFKFQAGQSVVMYFSFRLQPTPIAFPSPPKDHTQMWQIIHDVSCGQTPRLFMDETPDGVELNVHPYGGGPNNVIWQEDVARGAWHRLAIRLEMSTSDSQGKIQVWGDVNQSGELTQLSPMISTATLYGGACGDKADLFFGRYQHASVPGSQVDFANWQIAEWVH